MSDLKKLGCCVRCGREVYTILEYHASGPLDGHPRRVGRMLDIGTQITFALSDGTEADVAFCVDCARALTPADYQAVWDACVERADFSYRHSGREAVRKLRIAKLMAVWPVGVLRWRREAPEGRALILDERFMKEAA